MREDGGTPAFLQTIKAALCVRLKEQIGIDKMLEREHEIVQHVFPRLRKIAGLNILAPDHEDRLGVFSFYIDQLHFNLGVKLLNDRFGIQTRGGCSCAGTYGHYLLHIPKEVSNSITDQIDQGRLDDKPGWIRMSLHPTMSNEEIDYILDAIEDLARNFETWSKDYTYDKASNEFHCNLDHEKEDKLVESWFSQTL